jgi:hypothetical protein
MTDKQIAENVIRNWIQDEHLPRARMILSTDEICELMQAYHESKMREEKAKKFYDKNTCVVCHQNYVDSANGFDTCDYCLNRI